MVVELVPSCPRLHPGMMVPDDPRENIGREWVCRVCGTRLYGDDPSTATVAQISDEKPINESTGSGLNGRPRRNPVRRYDVYDAGGRGGRGGQWFE